MDLTEELREELSHQNLSILTRAGTSVTQSVGFPVALEISKIILELLCDLAEFPINPTMMNQIIERTQMNDCGSPLIELVTAEYSMPLNYSSVVIPT